MRQIVLDTETTGLSPTAGHRVIEVGCLELINRRLTGRQFHTYLNPEREVDEGAFNVHGIGTAFLQDKPLFNQIADDLVAFIDGAELIIHNAPFDVGFLNAEFMRVGVTKPITSFCQVLDTLVLAKQKHPGQKNNLDALCKRYDVNNADRTLHGALLDAELLALVYLAMTGGQIDLFGNDSEVGDGERHPLLGANKSLVSHTPVYFATDDELALHDAFMDRLKHKKSKSR